MAEITCSRCGQTTERLARPPIRGKIGQDIYESVCQACWDEWAAGEIMIINEYRLNLADPEHRKALYDQMREFFKLGKS